jgi:probable DNA repair protein
LLAWQSALDELARLTPIVGEISLDAALRELERLLARSTRAALPVRGVHVLGRIEDVGPGYDAVWVAGFTDAAWPEPPRGLPLLPLALQRAHGMPYSSPRDAQERSARTLDRLVRRSRELVISWPARVYDYDTEPSPAIRGWPLLTERELDALTAGRPLRVAARETLADDAPPLAGARVAGGTGALGRQARCPLRAFYQDRLGARQLEAFAFGVPARLRGIAAHRAAERLLGGEPTQADLAARAGLVTDSVERALASLFGRARGHLKALYELETEHLERSLAALLRADLARAPFRVRAVEQRATVAIGPLTFDVRIDRVDELADGTLAIVDYKTNARATSAEWFGPRLRDAQVPLYASQAAERVRAAVVARLTPAEVRYFGFWPDGVFPGRAAKAANPDTEAQLATWRAQLAELAGEIAAGDARVFVDDYDDATGAYAPLTRVFEQLGLARGSVARW